jgi:hypothetical protein
VGGVNESSVIDQADISYIEVTGARLNQKGEICVNTGSDGFNPGQIFAPLDAVLKTGWNSMVSKANSAINRIDNKALHRFSLVVQDQHFQISELSSRIGRALVHLFEIGVSRNRPRPVLYIKGA